MNKKDKLRVVIDTNIIISSFWGGNPEKILNLCKKSVFTTLISDQIIFEVSRVLMRIFGVSSAVQDILVLLSKEGELVNPTIPFNIILDDPSDNKFLECAVAGKADFIVSGDKHLLKLKSFRKIPILTPRQFLDGFLK